VRFTLQKLIVPRGGLPALQAELVEAALPVWGLFAAQIGARSDEVELIVAGEESPALESASVEHVHLLDATVRPTTTDRVTDDGVFAMRWFEIVEWNWPEFLQLSEGAWPGFEAANPGVRIHGFFRRADDPSKVLLVTRYPSLAAWEASRNADDAAGGANFRRRHELTLSTIVRTYRAVT
jgi:hypothetical protein